MRRALYYLLIILISSQHLFSQATSQEKEINSLKYSWQLYELDNGLRVLLQPDITAESVSTELWIDVGSRNEQAGRFGMAHFFEHATPYGLTEKEEKRKELLDSLINSNAQVKNDFTTYFLETTQKHLPLAIEYVADRFKVDPNTYFNDERTEHHRKNVLNEIERNSKHPVYGVTARTTRYKGVYGAHHPYGHSAYGYVEDNKLISTDELKRWYRANFRPEYSTLFVVGAFNAESIKEIINEQFKEIDGGERVRLIERRMIETNAQTTSIATNVHDYYQTITWAAPNWAGDDAATLELVSRIVDKRLTKIAEQDSSLIDAGSLSDTDFYQLAGHFGVSASYKELYFEEKTISILEEVIQKLITEGVTEQELNKAKDEAFEWIRKQTATMGFIGSRTRLLGKGLFFNNDPDTYHSRLKKQLSLSVKDVNEIARKYLSKSGFKLLLLPKRKS